MDHTPGRRGHGHRGRHGSDRRGPERRSQPAAPQQQARGEHVDVESIMRDIRARIARQQGVELTDHQIQELAARRLEAILDVRSLNPALMEQLRRSVGGRTASVPQRSVEAAAEFDEATLFDGGVRRLLRPILKLFFNPTPLVYALNAQAKANVEVARRDAERDQQQAEWNALHYELLKRLVTEVSRVSLEAQGLGLRVESLATKVDFNERRVRGLEGTVHETTARTTASAPVSRAFEEVVSPSPSGGDAAGAAATEGQRRRRRRRRGRRGNVPGEFVPGGAPAAVNTAAGAPPAVDEDEGGFEDEGIDDNGAVTTEGEVLAPTAPADLAAVAQEPPAQSAEMPAAAEPSPAPAPESHVDDPAEG